MGAIASQITSLAIVYSTVCSDTDQRKHRSSALLVFVRGIHRGPVDSPHKWPVTRKMFSFEDVIMPRICVFGEKNAMLCIYSNNGLFKCISILKMVVGFHAKYLKTDPGQAYIWYRGPIIGNKVLQIQIYPDASEVSRKKSWTKCTHNDLVWSNIDYLPIIFWSCHYTDMLPWHS